MLETGQSAQVERCYSREDIEEYVALGGAFPRADEVPPALVCALFSYLLGVQLPGTGTNYLKQRTEFVAPARIGEVLRAAVQITRIRPAKCLVDLATTCHTAQGDLLCVGRALVYVRDVDGALGSR